MQERLCGSWARCTAWNLVRKLENHQRHLARRGSAGCPGVSQGTGVCKVRGWLTGHREGCWVSVLVCRCWTGVRIGRCFDCRVSSRRPSAVRTVTARNCHCLTPFLAGEGVPDILFLELESRQIDVGSVFEIQHWRSGGWLLSWVDPRRPQSLSFDPYLLLQHTQICGFHRSGNEKN